MFKCLKIALCILAIVFQIFFVNEVAFSSQGAAVASDDTVPVRVKVGMTLEAEFPDKIANITKILSSDFLQVETLGNRMFLLPLKEFDSVIYVVTQDNASYCLHLIMDEAQAPTRLKLGKPKEYPSHPEAQKEALNTADVMKALILGRDPAGSSALNLHNYEIFNNGQFRILLNKVYEVWGGARALVATMENLMDKPIVLPIENIELPGLVAISVDSSMLEACPSNLNKENAKSSTKAYMVIQERTP